MAASMRFLWFVILSLCFLFYCSDAGHAKKKALPSAMVVGTVICDTSFHKGISKSGHFIAGAAIAIECGDSSTKLSFRGEVQTNRHGKFKIRLPTKTNVVGSCSVKLIRSSKRFCLVATSSHTSINKLRLKSVRGGVHVFSAGLFTFTPLNQNSDFQGSNSLGRNPNQRAFFFLPSPPIPFLPSPPNIGGVPLPPNPLMPQPPLLPPLPFQPPPPPFINLPPIPIITPPPAPPPTLFPPIPFPPNPLFPGIPPASSSKGVPP